MPRLPQVVPPVHRVEHPAGMLGPTGNRPRGNPYPYARETVTVFMARYSIDLRTLPRGLQYVIAFAVAALVMLLAWHVGRTRPTPTWLGPVQVVWTWLGPALLAFFILRWLIHRNRRQ